MIHDYDSKNIYLKKNNQIIGLHSIGYDNSEWEVHNLDGSIVQMKGFQPIESWGNEYDENYQMLGRGSFRIFADIEEAVKDMETDGWVRFEGPKNEKVIS